jgi:penicillin amidase
MRLTASKIILFAAFGSLVVIGTMYFLLWRSLPDYVGSRPVQGLEAPIQVLRSQEAVPYILAENDHDAFFGLGYVHAQDRMWQMEIARRTAKGRLSELLGAKTLRTDELLLRMGLYDAAKHSVAVQDEYTTAALESYSSGVNSFIKQREGYGRAAPEFLIFPGKLKPWTPADSLSIMKLMALQLASHVDREVLRTRVSRMVSEKELSDILPDDPHGGIAEMPEFSAMFPSAISGSARLAKVDPSDFLPQNGLSSNGWSVSPARSESGASLLANDPHLDLSAPGFWYLAGLSLERGDVIGGTIPGVPMVMSGRSQKLAWGLTAANMDDQDVYIEQLDPTDQNRVLTALGYDDIRHQTAFIPVRGQEPVEIELQWSHNGPIMPGYYYNLSEITPDGHVAAVARTLFDAEDRSLSAAHGLMQAQSVDEALFAMERFVTPAQNLFLADRDHIALQLIGKMPRRDPRHETQGRVPSRGWQAQNQWQGYMPYEDNPRFVDPLSGSLGNTNNKTVQRPFPRHVSFDWGDALRIHELEKGMSDRFLHSVESFTALQQSITSYPALTVLPLVLREIKSEDSDVSAWVDRLAAWDGRMQADRPEPLVYAAFMTSLQHGLADDELGDLGQEFGRPSPVFIERVFQNVGGAGAWCDDIQTSDKETCAGVAERGLRSALDWIEKELGQNPETAHWGDAHMAKHDHIVLGKVFWLGWFVNIRHPASGGDHTLMRALTRGEGPRPFDDMHASGYRAIYDLSQNGGVSFVVATGQSGHPLSRHYRDLNVLWRDGKYLDIMMEPNAGDVASGQILTLSPF